MDVVVEVAGGTAMEPILTAALAAGKPVVTANKALLASKLAELGVLAQRTATPLYCEAAAAAALPIIRHLSHRADEIDSLAGILNGTCNFVMTRMEQDELSLDDAVAEAQALGFAEADPSADLDGSDAAAKLSILAYRAFGAWVRPDGFLVRGIRELGPADSDLAESMGCRIRLIARAARIDGALDMAVEPLLLPSWHLLASVEEEYNAVYLRCASSGDLSLFGKGAGALPTATAVLGDLIDLAQDNSVRWPVPQALPVAAAGAAVRPAPRRHYLRVTGDAHPGPRTPDREPGAPRRAHRAEPRRAAPSPTACTSRSCSRRARTTRSWSVREAVGAAGPRRDVPVPRGPRVSGIAPLARPAGLPGRTPAAGRDVRGDARAPRRARRARAAHRARLPPPRRAHGAARSARLGARRRVAGGQGRVPLRQRGAWSDLPHLYARYGTTATAALIARLKALEARRRGAGLRLGDAGHGAGLRRADDARRARGADAAGLQQDQDLPDWLAERVGGSITIVDDGDHAALAAAIRPETRFVFAETFTNPLVRAQDIAALVRLVAGARAARQSSAWSSIRPSPRRGRSRRRSSTKASTSCWPAAPRRSAGPIAICGATSPPTTRRSPTRSWI